MFKQVTTPNTIDGEKDSVLAVVSQMPLFIFMAPRIIRRNECSFSNGDYCSTDEIILPATRKQISAVVDYE